MAWVGGTAQAEVHHSITVRIQVRRRHSQCVVEFVKEIDINHIGAQIKKDILEDQNQQIPQNMRNVPEQCLLVLCVDGKRIELGNFERLQKHEKILTENKAVVVEVLEPGAPVKDDVINLEQLNVQARE